MKLSQFFNGYTKGQRKGIIALFVLILIAQALYFMVLSFDFQADGIESTEERQWLELQAKADSIKAQTNRKDTIYPFNPNYMSDYKGYILGLSVSQIDKLNTYRASGRFINSVSDFQKVTGISDSLAMKLAPYIRLTGYKSDKRVENQCIIEKEQVPLKPLVLLDINAADEADLIKIYGIGPSYARMILRRRADLGAFVSMEQLDDFAEIPPDARNELKRHFIVDDISMVNRLNVNTASLQQLSHFTYFNRDIARAVITQRSMNGSIRKIDELLKIPHFPVDKVKIIALYLEF